MKHLKNLIITSIFLFIGVVALHSALYKTLINDPALSSSLSYSVDTNTEKINRLSAQVVYSSSSIAAASFSDGMISTAAITVSSNTALSSATATNTIVIASNTALTGAFASNTISIDSNSFLTNSTSTITLLLNSSTITVNKDFTPSSFSTQTAKNLSSAINTLAIYGITASTTGSGSTVTITAQYVGTAWNSFTLSASTAALGIGSASFTGGKDPASFTLNGIKFTASRDFSVDLNFTTNTAKNIAGVVNFSSYSITAATSTIGVSTGVTFTAITPGTYANTYTLTSSTVALTVASSTFVGGRDVSFIKVNSVKLVNGIDWLSSTTATGTAKAIADAINGSSQLSGVVISTWMSGGVVQASSTVINKNTYTLFTSTQGALAISTVSASYADGSALGYFNGGYDTNISTTTNYISTTNAFGLGLPVLYNKVAGTSPGLLVSQTTYYITAPDSQKFKLSNTSTGAVAGTAISISTQNTSGRGSFTLTPLSFTGSSSFKWQVSNDSATWADVNVSSITITSSTLTNSTTYWDFGNVNGRYYRVNFTSSTTGATNLKLYINGKE